MRSTFAPVEKKIGTNNLAEYGFSFKIEDKSQLLVVVMDDQGVEVARVRGTDTTEFLTGVDFDSEAGGGTVYLQADLPTDYEMHLIEANDAPTQPNRWRDQFSFTVKQFELALDFIVGAVQRVSWLSNRSVRLHDSFDGDFDMQLPPTLEADRVLMISPTGNGLVQGPTPEELAQASADASEVAEALAEIEIMAQQVADDAAQVATDAAQTADDRAEVETILYPGSYQYSGYSARFNEIFNTAGLSDTLEKILMIQYAAPLINLTASGNGTIREKGTAVTAVTLTAAVTKRSNDIDEVRFYKDGVLINTDASPNPAGGNSVYNWTGSFSDNTTFSAQVDDVAGGGGPTTVTSNAGFTFVYPYYVGAGAAGLTAAQVAALTKLTIASTATVNRTITAGGGNVFYFAYPASYGALTSILDVNNFETIGDWTLRTENITGLDGNAVSYRIYEFNNPVVAGDYFYSFRR